MSSATIESAKAWMRSRLDLTHGEPTPRLVGNIALVLGTDTSVGIAEPHAVQASTVRHWRLTGRVPLNYLVPYLRLMSYETLAFGDLTGTRHVGRGWTRDPRRAAPSGDHDGPVNMAGRSSFEDVIGRLRMLFGEDDAFHEGVEATRNQVVQWRKRAKVPDKTCRDVCDNHGVSMSWLLAGIGEAPSEG